jgi:hypothetical protein
MSSSNTSLSLPIIVSSTTPCSLIIPLSTIYSLGTESVVEYKGERKGDG